MTALPNESPKNGEENAFTATEEGEVDHLLRE